MDRRSAVSKTKRTTPLRRSSRVRGGLQQQPITLPAQGASPAPTSLAKPSGGKQHCFPEPPIIGGRKRARSEHVDGQDRHSLGRGGQKRARRMNSRISDDRTPDRRAASTVSNTGSDKEGQGPVRFWARHHQWPKRLFRWRNTMENQSSEVVSMPIVGPRGLNAGFQHPIYARGQQRPRDSQSLRYERLTNTWHLNIACLVMEEIEPGISTANATMCQNLLSGGEQKVPSGTYFDDDAFDRFCKKIKGRKDGKLLHDIRHLIVPSAELHATWNVDLEKLAESVCEEWRCSIPVADNLQPVPNYAAGFSPVAFSDDQKKKLALHGGPAPLSHFMATDFMFFPFLVCEAKTRGLGSAESSSAYDLAVAHRGVVKLFKLVKREEELDREVLGFSVSFDTQNVNIHCHYVVIGESDPTFHRQRICGYPLGPWSGEKRWQAYQFSLNVYTRWMPDHLKRICSAIDQLPDANFDVSPLSRSLASQRSVLRGSVPSAGAQSQGQGQSSLSSGMSPPGTRPVWGTGHVESQIGHQATGSHFQETVRSRSGSGYDTGSQFGYQGTNFMAQPHSQDMRYTTGIGENPAPQFVGQEFSPPSTSQWGINATNRNHGQIQSETALSEASSRSKKRKPNEANHGGS